jgi:hypothetical protein
MANGFSRSPMLLKGALIRFSSPLLVPVPHIIPFQYNPETLSRTLDPWAPPAKDDERSATKAQTEENSLAQPYDPEESFTLSLELDAADALEDPSNHPVAVVAGIADRIAALEMLLYPVDDESVSGVLNVSVNASLGAGGVAAGVAADVVPQKKVPIVLFFWGPGRIVPVRVTTFTVEEQAFLPILYPMRAKCTLGLKVLDAAALGGDTSAEAKIAKACYTFTRAQKQALAKVENTVEFITGRMPF